MTKSNMASRLTALLLTAILAPMSFAASGRMNFQGRLIDAASKNPKNGSFNITFRICDTETGSCVSPLWTESQAVPVVNGLFSAQLGAATPLTPSVFAAGSDRFLEIQVESETLATRERLANSAYAFRASLADDVTPNLAYYIQNTSSLQAGSGFHVSSGTLDGPMRAGSAVILTQLRLGNFTALPASDALGAGSMVFNTTDNNVYVSNGAAWTPLASGGPSPWSSAGGVVTLADPAARIQVATAAFADSLTLGGLSVLNNIAAGSGILVSGSGASRTIAANSGTGANQLLQLTSAGALPALDGSALTGVSGGYRSVTLLSDALGAAIAPIAIGSELQGLVTRRTVDLTGAAQVRAQFASSLTSTAIKCRIEFSTDDGSSWNAAPLVPDFAAGASADKNSRSAWSALPGPANADVLVRAIILGDGVQAPTIRYIELDYK